MNNVFLLQLDGVSGPVLDFALKENLMPFTKSLVEQGWVKRDFFCGLPSTTPASQISLLYGLHNAIVGFRFLRKKDHEIFTPMNLVSVELAEERAKSINPNGLLRDGASVCTIFSGGSKESISAGGIAKNKKFLLQCIRFLANPLRFGLFFFKIIIFFIIEHKEYAIDENGQLFKGLARLKHVFKRMLEETADGELALYFSKQMIRKNVPVIYADFTGYDEIAHNYGPESKFSMYYLSMLDVYIQSCYRELLKSNVPYELIIVSDHGQTPSIPFEHLIKKSLVQVIAESYPKRHVFMGETDTTYENISGSDMVIMASGGFGLVYDLSTTEHLSQEELEKRYPNFFERISNLPGIQCVLGKNTDGAFVARRGSQFKLTSAITKEVFPTLPESITMRVFEELSGLVASADSADAYIIGEIFEHSCVGFEMQLGAHGSVGGDQTSSFCLSRNFSFDPESIRDYADIYQALHSYIYPEERKRN